MGLAGSGASICGNCTQHLRDVSVVICRAARGATRTNPELHGLRSVARGPGNLAKPSDLWFNCENFGGAVSFARTRYCAWAPQVRVFESEARASVGLRIRDRAQVLSDAETDGECMGRRRLWANWYSQSHVRVLLAAVERMEQVGVTIPLIIGVLARDAPHPWTLERRAAIKRGFQRQLRIQLLARHRPDAEERVRKKLVRWKLDGVPRNLA